MDLRVGSPGETLFNQMPGRTSSAGAPGESFSQILKRGLAEATELLREADTMTGKLALGQVDDLAQVMIATEKAQLAMELTLQVRNKLLEAYQEIMRIQV